MAINRYKNTLFRDVCKSTAGNVHISRSRQRIKANTRFGKDHGTSADRRRYSDVGSRGLWDCFDSFAYFCTTTLFPHMRGRYIPRLLRFENFLNNRIARLRNSLICIDPESPGYLGLTII